MSTTLVRSASPARIRGFRSPMSPASFVRRRGNGRRPFPVPAVDDLVDGTATSLQRRRAAVVGALVADGDRADGRVLVGHAERRVEGRVLRRLDAEEAGGQALVD